MNRYEADFYQDVSTMKEIMKRMNCHLSDIADALYKGNATKAIELSDDINPELITKSILDAVKVCTDDYTNKPKIEDKINKENKK